MAQTKRIRINGIRRREIDTDLLAYVYFLQGKRLVQQRREREAEAKAKRRKRQTRKDAYTGDRP
jgi:hypothetical protein